MTAPESALDVAREVCPDAGWYGLPTSPHADLTDDVYVYLHRHPDGEWWAVCGVHHGIELMKRGRNPRACLRAVLAEVHAWALGVARATVPAGYQLVTACVPPEIPGEDPDPIY